MVPAGVDVKDCRESVEFQGHHSQSPDAIRLRNPPTHLASQSLHFHAGESKDGQAPSCYPMILKTWGSGALKSETVPFHNRSIFPDLLRKTWQTKCRFQFSKQLGLLCHLVISIDRTSKLTRITPTHYTYLLCNQHRKTLR